MDGNALSYVALLLSLPLGVALFFALRPPLATVVVLLSFAMLLPEHVSLDAPGIPNIGKYEAASIACMLGLLLRGRRRLREARPFRGPEWLVLLLFVGDVATVLTNGDPLVYGPTVLPGLGMGEAVSLVYFDVLWLAVPFLAGRALVTSSGELKLVLTALVVAGALYTPLLFTELVMSPQLHRWVYGFHQHGFDQTLRGGGYRPMVFMPHGLAVALLMAWTVLAALALVKARRAVAGVPAPVAALYNFGFLAACKSTGAILYSVTFAPLLLWLTPKTVARVVAVVGLLVLGYPVTRALGWFPAASLVEAARVISPERSQSLGFRLEMEELIAQHAAERPWFGWGRFDRNVVFDRESGRPISVSDGHWIIVYSIHGIIGFLGVFLLLVAPLLALRKRMGRVEDAADRALLAGLALIVASGVVDLIPNGLFTPLTVFLAGALAGSSRALSASVLGSPAPISREGT